jgi:hypothetical protein
MTSAEAARVTDREAGALLLWDAGSPADTRWIDDRDDLPRIVRAGKHIARTRRYIRNYAHEIEPDELVAHVRMEARRGDGWVKLVGDWIDRDAGDHAPWPADVARRHRRCSGRGGPGHRALLRRTVRPGTVDAASTASVGTGLDDTPSRRWPTARSPLVPTRCNLEIFPGIADQAEERSRLRTTPARHVRTAR